MNGITIHEWARVFIIFHSLESKRQVSVMRALGGVILAYILKG